jgi:glutaminyl-tRNA synthetase
MRRITEGAADPAKIRTRFPPEPNGYLHVGHAKSICLNFGLALDYGGICHLRFDDTNPRRKRSSTSTSIQDAVQWLGYTWDADGTEHLYQASDYFDFMYRAAEYLIEAGDAYVDEQTPEQMRANRGDFGTPGSGQPLPQPLDRGEPAALPRDARGQAARRRRGAAREDRHGQPQHQHAGPGHLPHQARGAPQHRRQAWCIYPMYTFAHPIEDALENITHSICTLEFEDQRPFYDWLVDHLAAGGLVNTRRRASTSSRG